MASAVAVPTWVYCLMNSRIRRTYVGVTANPRRRLRQHNCELKGGAKYTTHVPKFARGHWRYVFTVRFPTRQDALRTEWRLHGNRTKAISSARTLEEKRISQLVNLLTTTKQSSTLARPWATMEYIDITFYANHWEQFARSCYNDTSKQLPSSCDVQPTLEYKPPSEQQASHHE